MARDATAHRPLTPLTIDHWRAYARLMVLDDGERWVPEPFQEEIVDELLAGVPEVWVDIPEGNGKTTLLGGVVLYHGDYTPGAMVPMAASSKDQTWTLFRQAAGFVTRTPGPTKRFRVYEGYRWIKCLRTGGLIQVFAADDRTGDGIIPSLGIVEEGHRHPDLRLYRTWRGKLEKRGGQIVSISTPGEPGSEYENVKDGLVKTAKVTRDGAHLVARTDEFVLHHYGLRDGDDVHDLKLVKQANPFTGVSLAGLRRKHDSPTFLEAHWKRFTCGIATRGEHSAIAPEEWSALKRTLIPEGVPIWAGGDLGWKWDTTAVTPLWLPEPKRHVLGIPQVVVPPRDGTSTPPAEIRAAFLEVHERNPIHTVVLDPNAGGEQLAEWIEDELGARVIAWGQTNEPQALAFERFLESVREGWLEHPYDDTLTAHVLNAIAKPVLGGDRHRFDRPRSTRDARGQDQRVIDALSAAAGVLAAAVAGEEEPKGDKPGIEIWT